MVAGEFQMRRTGPLLEGEPVEDYQPEVWRRHNVVRPPVNRSVWGPGLPGRDEELTSRDRPTQDAGQALERTVGVAGNKGVDVR